MNVWVKSHPKYKVWSESDCQAFARDVSDRICKSTVQLETQIAFAERIGNLLINSAVPTLAINDSVFMHITNGMRSDLAY